MNKTSPSIVLPLLLVTIGAIASCTGTSDAPDRGSDTTRTYLGEPPPGAAPQSFAPGVVNTDEAIELNGVVSPDGREFFFTRVIDDVFVMHRRLLGDDGRFGDPEPVYTFPDRAPGLAVQSGPPCVLRRRHSARRSAIAASSPSRLGS